MESFKTPQFISSLFLVQHQPLYSLNIWIQTKCLWGGTLLASVVTYHHDLSMWLFVWRSKDHPVGSGSKAVAHFLGIRDRHGGDLSIILQEHQLPGQTGHSLSLKTTEHQICSQILINANCSEQCDLCMEDCSVGL